MEHAHALVGVDAACPAYSDPDCLDGQTDVPGSVPKRTEPPPTSTGRRRPLDDYPTPEWVIRAIAPYVSGARVLDPCCGSGAILDVFRERAASVSGIEIAEQRADEARAKGHEVVLGDALEIDWPRADLIITNPPYSRAQEFAEKALASVEPGGTVALLLRLAFLEGKRRVAFHRAHGSSVFVLASRPSFTGNGRCDASAYAWFLWGPRYHRTIHILDAVDPARRSRTETLAGPEMRPIPGAPGYLASSDGRIYSTWRRAREGQRIVYFPDGEPRELSAYDRKTAKGEPTPYRSVMIKWADGTRKPAYVHHLVALTFLGPRPPGAEVLHGPKGANCNAADNLRYGTPDENGAERAHCRDDDWYRARGMCPPRFRERHDIEASADDDDVDAASEPAGAFNDLLGEVAP